MKTLYEIWRTETPQKKTWAILMPEILTLCPCSTYPFSKTEPCHFVSTANSQSSRQCHSQNDFWRRCKSRVRRHLWYKFRGHCIKESIKPVHYYVTLTGFDNSHVQVSYNSHAYCFYLGTGSQEPESPCLSLWPLPPLPPMVKTKSCVITKFISFSFAAHRWITFAALRS